MKRLLKSCAIVVLCLSTGLVACKEDPMTRARSAHATERADEAEAALKEVLAQSPDDFEARRLMADVYRFRGDYARTEEELQKLWKEKGFDDESKEFPPEVRAQRDLLENQLNELYNKWSDSLEDGSKDPDTYVRVTRQGLELNPKSPTLNRKLVEFHTAKAQALEKEGKKLDAALAYEEVLQLRTMPNVRKDSKQKAEELRKAAFVDAAQKAFDENVKPELQKNEQWNEEAQKVAFTIEASVDRKLRGNKDADLAAARKQAAEALRAGVTMMVAKITGLTPEEAAKTPVKVDSSDESLNRGAYSVKVAIAPADAIDAAFKTRETKRLAAEKAADKLPEGGEKEPAEKKGEEPTAGSNAGSADADEPTE